MDIFDKKNSWAFLTKKTNDIFDKKTKDIFDKKTKRKPYLCTQKTPTPLTTSSNIPKHSPSMKSFFSFLFLILIALVSCTTDSDSDLYAHERAFLKFSPVTGVIPLYTAVQNSGHFCTIRIGTNSFIFQGSNDKTTTSYPISAEIKGYGTPECIAGFVVGRSSQPDINMQYPLVAYDLACPNCYEQALITRNLSLNAKEELTCSRCHRVYDLTNGGLVKQGDKGCRLKRYRNVGYSENQGGLLVIMN